MIKKYIFLLVATISFITSCNLQAKKSQQQEKDIRDSVLTEKEQISSSKDKIASAHSDSNAVLNAVVVKSAEITKNRKATDTSIGMKSKSTSDPSGFIVINDLIADVIVETRYYSTYNFVGERIDGYTEPVALCTREAGNALKKVADDLRKKGYLIKIFDAYRPQKAVDHFCRWALTKDTKMKNQFYPNLNKNTLFPKYVARKSGHTKGSTFDLTIVDISTKRNVDMGGTFDFFGTKSHYDYANITAQQKANRKLLHDVMIKYGFKPYSSEWWHFTLKNEPYPNMYFTFDNNSELIK